MSNIYNIYDKNIRGNVGFFGGGLITSSYNVMSPTTLAGGNVISTDPDLYGSVFTDWSDITGGWGYWNPDNSIIPQSSNVDYAALIYSAAYYGYSTTPPPEIISPTHDVILEKPDGTTVPVSPNPNWNFNFNVGWWQFTHGQDITSIMQDNQYGEYKITSIPINQTGGGAWGIYIVYSNPYFPYRNINLNVGATGFNSVITIPNLILPTTGPVSSSLYALSVQGDAGYPDGLLLNGVYLSGPFNPIDDFMNDKLVDYTGLALQTKGCLISLPNGTQSESAWYMDQTVIHTTTILNNTDTEAVIVQDNSGDWAGVAQIGLMTDLLAANINPIKTVDKTIASPGDTLNYTVILANTGTTTAINVFFTDTYPAGVMSVPGSFAVNGVPISGSLSSGITIPDIDPNTTSTVTFNTIVPNTMTWGIIDNSSNLNYLFVPSPGTTVSSNIDSNYVSTEIINPIVKSVDMNFATVGTTLTYTITIINSASTSSNFILYDTIPNGLSYVSGSAFLNGVAISGDPNPPSGINLGNLLTGVINTITYNAVVNFVPVSNPATNQAYITGGNNPYLSNSVQTQINYAGISPIKAVDKSYSDTGTLLAYTISMHNTGNVTAYNVTYVDTIPSSTGFQSNSVSVNGVVQPGKTVSPPSGITIPNISPGAIATVTFNVQISNTIPVPNPIQNIGTVRYDYLLDPILNITITKSGINTNIVSTTVSKAILTSTKAVNHSFADIGTILTYTITIPNTGNTTANSIVFIDTIPSGLTFLNSSFLQDGTLIGSNPNPPGVILPESIGPNSISTVTFQVQVTSIPLVNPASNTACIAYYYTYDPIRPNLGNGVVNSNTVSTQVSFADISQISKSATVSAMP